MPKLLDMVKGAVLGAIYPERFRKTGDEAYRHLLYSESQAAPTTRGQWYQLRSAGGQRTGFEFLCLCGVSYKLPGTEAIERPDYVCPQCKRPFDFPTRVGLRLPANKDERIAALKKFTGYFTEQDYANGTLPFEQWQIAFSLLPTHADGVARGEGGGPKAVSTWDESAGGVEYEQSDPKFI
jgi:hypothetical protein